MKIPSIHGGQRFLSKSLFQMLGCNMPKTFRRHNTKWLTVWVCCVKLPLLILGGGVYSIWKNNMIWVTLRDFYARVLTDIPSSWQYVSQGSTKIIEWCLLLLKKKKNYFVFTLQHIFNWWVMSYVTSIRLFFFLSFWFLSMFDLT